MFIKNEGIKSSDADPFGLHKLQLSDRIPERSEMFTAQEAKIYTVGCDYPESVDDLLLAWEIQERFINLGFQQMRILDAMTGPGRLGRELLGLGLSHVTFHDGHNVMLEHAREKAGDLFPSDRFSIILAPVDQISASDNTFDLVVCHNSTHQLESVEKLKKTIAEFVRVTKPGGWIMIADYQRNSTPEFIVHLEERLKWTKKEIVPLLLPTFQAAFSKEEFDKVALETPNIQKWLVFDASLPLLTPEKLERVNQDPVKGHVLDFSPISCRMMMQKEKI